MKLAYHEPLSKVAFNFNLRRYTKGRLMGKTQCAEPPHGDECFENPFTPLPVPAPPENLDSDEEGGGGGGGGGGTSGGGGASSGGGEEGGDGSVGGGDDDGDDDGDAEGKWWPTAHLPVYTVLDVAPLRVCQRFIADVAAVGLVEPIPPGPPVKVG